LIILFSPSEGKLKGGSGTALNPGSLLFPELCSKRLEVLELYNTFVHSTDAAALSKLFGIKDLQKVEQYRTDIFKQPTMKAVERYDGVAYDYLKYPELTEEAKAYVDTHTIIFSNLFGPLRAADEIPEYKLKQGEKIDGFATETFYKKEFSEAMDTYIGDQPLLDLRAGFYDKFYKPSVEYMTLKFIKGGKVVSHWAKAYRGTVLKRMAEEKIETAEAFMKMEIEGLRVKEILKQGRKTEVVYDIIV